MRYLKSTKKVFAKISSAMEMHCENGINYERNYFNKKILNKSLIFY